MENNKDYIITTDLSAEDTFYFASDIETLPKSAIEFKYIRNTSFGTVVTDYRIGIPIEKPVRLVGNEGTFDINANGKAEYGIYTDGENNVIFNIGANTRVVDNFESLEAAFYTEKTMKQEYVRG